MYTIRAASRQDIPGISRVHVDSWRTTYPGIVPAAFLSSLSYESNAQTWQWIFDCAESDGNFTFVAEDAGGTITGFANGGPERSGDAIYKGELNAIYILKQHQGAGLGRRLVSAVTGRLVRSGIGSMLVWVLVDNQSCRFYERLGGERIREKTLEIGGQECLEAAYGWRNISAINK